MSRLNSNQKEDIKILQGEKEKLIQKFLNRGWEKPLQEAAANRSKDSAREDVEALKKRMVSLVKAHKLEINEVKEKLVEELTVKGKHFSIEQVIDVQKRKI